MTFCGLTGDFIDGKRTGVTLYLGEDFELHLSVDGLLTQNERRYRYTSNEWKKKQVLFEN